MGKRLIQQRRGRVKGRYNVPSHRFKGKVSYHHSTQKRQGVVEDIIHDPGRSAPLALIRMNDTKEISRVIAAEGTMIGDIITFSGDKEDIKPGNIAQIGDIAESFPIYNIELNPGDGGKLVRTGGSMATVVSHGTDTTVVRLPSGAFKTISSQCRATIGAVSGGGRKDKPFLKAGKKSHLMRTRGRLHPVVSGVAQNPVNHPHGGGGHQHVGKPYTVKRGAPPGRKVGSIAAKKTGGKK
jgi:large subunit ribosomal protein L2